MPYADPEKRREAKLRSKAKMRQNPEWVERQNALKRERDRAKRAANPIQPRTATCIDCGDSWPHEPMHGALPKRCEPCGREHANAPRREGGHRYVPTAERAGEPNTPSRSWRRSRVLARKFKQHLRAPGYRWCNTCNQLHHSTSTGYASCHLQAEMQRAHVKVNSRIRRARKRGTEAERVVPRKVFERDGWRCQRLGCGKITTDAVEPKHDRRAVLGHVNALAAGGPHTYANVVCLCHPCNAADGVNRLPIQFVMEVM